MSPDRPVDQFITEVDILVQKLHDISAIIRRQRPLDNLNEQDFLDISNVLIIFSQSNVQVRSIKKNYSRLVKRLKHKFRLNKR